MFALAITDLRWQAQMLADGPQSLVNFWTPTPWRVRLAEGFRFGFMLKAPVRRIGGFGTFVRYEEATVQDAWARYGPANGVASAAELESRVTGFARRRSARDVVPNPIIGCVVLEACVFLPDEHQVSPAELGLTFPREVVKFKTFEGELTLPFERDLPDSAHPFRLVTGEGVEKELIWKKRRLAQPLFRSQVLAAYEGRCAVTGTGCADVLDAAHIQPFINLTSNHVQNGLALRKDVHALFDAGLLAVDEGHRVVLSERLPHGGYAKLAGRNVRLPSDSRLHPSPIALAFHRERVFRS